MIEAKTRPPTFHHRQLAFKAHPFPPVSIMARNMAIISEIRLFVKSRIEDSTVPQTGLP